MPQARSLAGRPDATGKGGAWPPLSAQEGFPVLEHRLQPSLPDGIGDLTERAKLAVNKGLEYAVLEHDGQRVILATTALERYDRELGGWTRVGTVTGALLAGQLWRFGGGTAFFASSFIALLAACIVWRWLVRAPVPSG